jgi:Xaa-Pro aminopeptidase
MNEIKKRIEQLQKLMRENSLAAWIIPGTDPHMSEYLPPRWKEREYMSGFTGSMGIVVITLNESALWTDSRYYLQGETQLKDTGIMLMRKGQENVPEPAEWLTEKLQKGESVGINPLLFPVVEAKRINNILAAKGIRLDTGHDLLSGIMTVQESAPKKIVPLDEAYSGESAVSKISRVRKHLGENSNKLLLLSALDQIAWLFNLRGSDVSYNPVFIAYAAISNSEALLFTDERKIDSGLRYLLSNMNISVRNYDDFLPFVSRIQAGTMVIIDELTANVAVKNHIPASAIIAHEPSVVNRFKSIKNDTELSGFEKAMLNDGVALTKFHMWFEKEHTARKKITEFDVVEKLKHFRSLQPGFKDVSFYTIASYNENGAIVHYSPTREGCATIGKNGVLLIDSGGQYVHGTTDITRTLALGTVSPQCRNDYTRVLQGHIGLASAVFPSGTTGIQLDVLARIKMWKEGLDYGHGTGHGVGHYLNVHEGPQTIRKEGNNIPLVPGMVLTIEPGLYRQGQYGLRVENMVYVKEHSQTDYGVFYAFGNLTLFPIDLSMINLNLLSPKEISWLNNYHKQVADKLSPLLNDEEKQWLRFKSRQV